jgi:hypothetical protein
MTYSEIVHLLSSHLVPAGRENQMIPLLEKFVNETQSIQGEYIGMDESEEMDEFERDPVNFRQVFDRGDFPESRVDEEENEQTVDDQTNNSHADY